MPQKNNRKAALSTATNAMQEGQARSLDALTEFETFREMFLPEIRKALLEGLNEKQIMDKFKPIMAARLVQIGGTGSETAAIAAIKEIFDRRDGKPLQAVDHTHRLGKLPDKELDAVLLSKLNKTKVIDVTPIESEPDKEEDIE